MVGACVDIFVKADLVVESEGIVEGKPAMS